MLVCREIYTLQLKTFSLIRFLNLNYKWLYLDVIVLEVDLKVTTGLKIHLNRKETSIQIHYENQVKFSGMSFPWVILWSIFSK